MDFSYYTTPRDAAFDEYVESQGGVKANQLPLIPDKKELQTMVNAMRTQKSQERLKSLDHNIIWHDITIPAGDGYEMPTRVYKHKDAVSTEKTPLAIFDFIHGGGYLFGSLDTEDYFCVRVLNALYEQGTPCILVNSIYRHTPDYAFPTIYQDGIDTFNYIIDNPDVFLGHHMNTIPRVVIGGISAGGGISIAVAMNELERSKKEGTENRVAGAWLTIPVAFSEDEYPKDLIQPGKSSLTDPDCTENVAGLAKATVDYFLEMLVPDPAVKSSKWLNPVLVDSEHFTGFPKCSFQICGADPLRDGALILSQNFRKVGVEVVDEVVYNGLPHAFWNANIDLDCSKKFYSDTVQILRKLL